MKPFLPLSIMNIPFYIKNFSLFAASFTMYHLVFLFLTLI